MSASLQSKRDGPLLVLSLNRVERRNALSPALIGSLLRALKDAAATLSDPDGVRAVVLRAQGKYFCAGGDLGPDGMSGQGLLAQHRARESFVALLLALHDSPLPVVAAVQGDALGGGAGLVAACHLVVMAQDARIATPELALGLFPWMITPVLLRKLPRNLLHQMILCGHKLSAAEAKTVGFANQIVSRAQLDAAACDLARAAAAHSPAIMSMGLVAMAGIDDQPLEDALRYMHSQLSLNLLTDDAAEGISAFMAHRPPAWKGS
ncbi:MAG: hypothetical protein GXP62_19155 [Oligoflexia bacterium]|nr:hypothetical protein [Oligoflexia bacterium]